MEDQLNEALKEGVAKAAESVGSQTDAVIEAFNSHCPDNAGDIMRVELAVKGEQFGVMVGQTSKAFGAVHQITSDGSVGANDASIPPDMLGEMVEFGANHLDGRYAGIWHNGIYGGKSAVG